MLCHLLTLSTHLIFSQKNLLQGKEEKNTAIFLWKRKPTSPSSSKSRLFSFVITQFSLLLVHSRYTSRRSFLRKSILRNCVLHFFRTWSFIAAKVFLLLLQMISDLCLVWLLHLKDQSILSKPKNNHQKSFLCKKKVVDGLGSYVCKVLLLQ